MKDVIVFDLDGTLVDSAAEIRGAMEAAWHALERGPFPAAKLRIGPALSVIVQELGPGDPPALAAEFKARYDASDFSATTPFPGILEMLDRLGRASVATNKRHAPTRKIVERWFAGRFQRVACADALDGVPGTYDKAAMLRALGGTVLVGDTVGDIQAARAAGARVVAVSWGYESKAELERAQPDALVHDPTHLFDALAPFLAPA